jgi:hypothetical protein
MTTPYRPLIRTQTELQEAWRCLVRPLGFHRRSLWLLLIDGDDRPTPVMTEVTDLPETVDRETTQGLAEMLAHLSDDVDPQGRWALLLSRPGSGGSSTADRAWVGALYATCQRHGIPHDVVHLATDVAVLPVPLDEVTDYVQAS